MITFTSSSSLILSPTSLTFTFGCAVLFLIITADIIKSRSQRRRLGDQFTIVGDASYLRRRLKRAEVDINIHALFKRGYENFSKLGKPWAFWGQHDEFVIVMPPETCDEIKNVDSSKLSFLQAVEDSFQFSLHTNMLGRAHVEAVRLSVNKNLGQLHESIVAQVDKSLSATLEELRDNDWHTFNAFKLFWHLVHTVAAAFIIGPDLANEPEYMRGIETYCLIVPQLTYFYFLMPSLLRKPFWWLSPLGFMVRSCVSKLKAAIVPEIRRRIEAARRGEGTQKQYVLLDAILAIKFEKGIIRREFQEQGRAKEEIQIQIVAEEVIFMAFESAGPVTVLAVHLIYELIAHPEYLKPLREELSSALEATQGAWLEQTLARMPKLESFIRETLRFDGPTIFSVTRTVMQQHKLKSGVVLQPGMLITTPSWLIHTDPDSYPDATTFDGLRFYDPATNTSTTRVTTVSNKFLTFGYGSQVCPGRFLGVKMAQTLLAKILLEYELDFAGTGKAKPENLVLPGQIMPNLAAKIKMKRRDDLPKLA